MAKYINKKHKEDIFKVLEKISKLTDSAKEVADYINEIFPDDYAWGDGSVITKSVKNDAEKIYKEFKKQIDRIAEW